MRNDGYNDFDDFWIPFILMAGLVIAAVFLYAVW